MAPEKTITRVIPIAPSASSRSASCTTWPSRVAIGLPPPPLKDIVSMICRICRICPSSPRCPASQLCTFCSPASLEGFSFSSATSCSSAAKVQTNTSARSISAIRPAILRTRSVWNQSWPVVSCPSCSWANCSAAAMICVSFIVKYSLGLWIESAVWPCMTSPDPL
ncbi:hypothetical protein D3C73_1301010 [compost metagenome]